MTAWLQKPYKNVNNKMNYLRLRILGTIKYLKKLKLGGDDASDQWPFYK